MKNVKITNMKVSGKTSVKSLATSITRTQGTIILACIGASSVNQAVKACAIARGFLATHGKDIYMIPFFSSTDIDGKNVSVINFKVEIR